MRIRFHPAARSELAEAIAWYEDDYPGRGVRFRHAVDRELVRVLSAPESFPKWRQHARARSVVIPRFPYTVIFAVEPPAVVVYAVAHDKRRPGYWRRRLTQRLS
jgi:plasmid stabilization system protein ParE